MCRTVGVVVVVLVGGVVWGQPVATEEVTCPVDGRHFRLPMAQPGDSAGGTDSDQCPHDRRGQTLAGEVVVCPRCNYAAGRAEFVTPVSEEQRGLLMRALAGSEYRGVNDGLTDIPAWERFRLAATCAGVLGKEKEQLNYLEFASWSARIEATRAATVAYSSLGRMITPVPMQLNEWISTRGIGDVIHEIDEKVSAAADAAQRNRLLLHLAMMHQRAGFTAKRDEVLKKLAEAAGSDDVLAARVDRFRKLVAVETDFQKQVVTLTRKRLEKTETRWERTTLNYLLADTLRRLGEDPEALKHYRAARQLMNEPGTTRRLTDHFLSILAPGEPLPMPLPEEKPKEEKSPLPTETPKE